MQNYYRVKPSEIEGAAPKGMYITPEEKIRTAAYFVITAAYLFVSCFFKYKFKRHKHK